MPSSRLALAAATFAAITFAGLSAHADPPVAGPAPEPGQAPAPGGTTVVAPPGSGGLTVVAPTAGGGTVTATGCTTVMVSGSPTLVGPNGAPCPAYAPYAPYAPYGYGPPVQYEARPRYQRDTDRTAALIGSSISFGVGALIAGSMYLIRYDEDNRKCSNHYGTYTGNGTYAPVDNSRYCGHPSASASLVAYGAIVAVLPSVPRFVVGDTTGGLIYTGLRGAAVAAAALVPWGDSDTNWEGPFLLGFAAPITLGIIDLATTPHREDLEQKAAQPGISSIAPMSLYDPRTHSNGVLMSMSGIF